jgi:hypothetical protein
MNLGEFMRSIFFYPAVRLENAFRRIHTRLDWRKVLVYVDKAPTELPLPCVIYAG